MKGKTIFSSCECKSILIKGKQVDTPPELAELAKGRETRSVELKIGSVCISSPAAISTKRIAPGIFKIKCRSCKSSFLVSSEKTLATFPVSWIDPYDVWNPVIVKQFHGIDKEIMPFFSLARVANSPVMVGRSSSNEEMVEDDWVIDDDAKQTEDAPLVGSFISDSIFNSIYYM